MTDSPSSEVRLLLTELISSKSDEVIQHRKNTDGTTTTYVVRSRKSLLSRVHDILEPGPAAPTDNGPGKGGKKKPSPPLPVATDAFNLLVTVHAAARQMEAELRAALGRQETFDDSPRGVHRGGTVIHTCQALSEVATLLEALERVNAEHPLVVGAWHDTDQPKKGRKPGRVLSEVRRWHRDATMLVGFRAQWARLRYIVEADPDNPDAKPKRRRAGCPYCQAQSLKQRPNDGAVVCCNPACTTPTGDRATWSIDDLQRLGLVLVQDKPTDTQPDPTPGQRAAAEWFAATHQETAS